MTGYDTDVLVAGGGISGLAAAWWLGQAGLEVELWEGDNRLGGKICTDQAQGFTTERSATLILNFRKEVDALMRNSGLDTVRLPRAPALNRYLVRDGHLIAAPGNLLELLRSPLWSARGKLRLALEAFAPSPGPSDESVASFVTRRFGRETYECAFEPYVSGPLANDAEFAEARAVLPRLTAMESQYGSITAALLRRFLRSSFKRKSAQSFSFVGGMSTLISTLANAPHCRCVTGRKVVALDADGCGGWVVTGNDGTQYRARHVVLGLSASRAAQLLRGIAPQAAQLLRDIPHAPISVLHLGFAREAIAHSLDGTGMLFGRQERLAPTGCMWTSRLLPQRAPQGSVLLDCYLGGARCPSAAHWNEARSIDTCLDALNPTLNLREGPRWCRIDRHPDGLPLYHHGHLARMTAIDQQLQQLSGLHLTGNYRGGISVRDRIIAGHELAAQILPYNKRQPQAQAVTEAGLALEPVR